MNLSLGCIGQGIGEEGSNTIPELIDVLFNFLYVWKFSLCFPTRGVSYESSRTSYLYR